MSKIYFDTVTLIYFLDNEKPFSEKVARFIFEHQNNDDVYVTSSITDAEYLVFPYKNNDEKKIETYNKFLKDFNFQIVQPSREISQKAAMLRAKYQGLKGMDSIHLSTSIYENCDIFLTNDSELLKIKEAKVILVDDLSN